jgi:hypothetical protein
VDGRRDPPHKHLVEAEVGLTIVYTTLMHRTQDPAKMPLLLDRLRQCSIGMRRLQGLPALHPALLKFDANYMRLAAYLKCRDIAVAAQYFSEGLDELVIDANSFATDG